MTSYVKIWGKWSNYFSLKVSKNYFSQVYGHKFCQIVINGVNLGENVPNGFIFGVKMTSYLKIWGSGQIISTLNVSKNYFSQVYEQKSGQKVINGVNFVKIGHFW